VISLQVRGREAGLLSASERAWMRRRAARLLALLDRPASQLSIVITDDEEIHVLNREWRGKDRPTDVLSFSQLEGLEMPGGPALLGDVVISLPTTRRQSRRRGRGRDALRAELVFLLIHGVLHLLGHDHLERAQARLMRAEEERLWSGLGHDGPARG
jgi:probable rRNA maturation factor